MLLALAALCLIVGVSFAGEFVTGANRRRRAALDRVTEYVPLHPFVPREERRRLRLSEPLTEALARITVQLTPARTRKRISTKIAIAGLLGRTSLTGFLATKFVLGALGVVLGLALGGIGGSGGRTVLLVLVLGALGFLGPDVVLSRRASQRQEEIAADLPTALELLAIAVEAGLALDAAISTLTKHLKGTLADEFAFVLAETRIGETRAEAIRKLAERVPTPEMTFFSNTVIQGERLGLSLGQIMRTLAADSRRRRQLVAEERAGKLPIRLLFPMAIFIMPALFIVVIGPALITVFGALN